MTTNEKQEHYLACEQQAHDEGLEVTSELYAHLKFAATSGDLDVTYAIEQIADAIEKIERRLNGTI